MIATIQQNFIQRTATYSTLEAPIAAPLFRKPFFVAESVKLATLIVASPGFYEVHLNGEDITKGLLAPYRSNPDHYVYYDEYDITDRVVCGENVVGCIAGNGLQNAVGAGIWSFDKAVWRGAPCVAFGVKVVYENGEEETFYADATTKTAPSAILFDDLHYGEYYDARLEQDGWDTVGFDDSGWETAQMAPTPRGELRLCGAEPIVIRDELKPVAITPFEDGYIYDFGVNNAGLCRLTIQGEAGQKIVLRHCEVLKDGKPFFQNIRFNDGTDRYQEDEYTCKGDGVEVHMPRFTYHGFRYVHVTGVRLEQATEELLTYVLFSSAIRSAGHFTCDNDIINRLQEATVRSDISNFHYFPTDCPQREKNGWTADASLSAEQMLLNFTTENSYREWLQNIYKALNDKGQLPGIIPTAGWGYHWGNGPAWDNVIVNLPYFTYKYRGDKGILQDVAVPLMRYLTYLYSRRDERGLLEFGLGDWCQPDRLEHLFDTPLVVTDSILTVDIAEKAAFFYDVLEMPEQKRYAQALADGVRQGIREHLIDYTTMTVAGNTQTAQCMAIYYGIFEENEKPMALERLVERIHEKDDFINTGVLGGRVIFRVLADNGLADLALHMMNRPEFPSYGNWLKRGATTLWEGFFREDAERVLSMNHHFWGDISAWYYTYLAGMRINPTARDVNEVNIAPLFPQDMNRVDAAHTLPAGELQVAWTRVGDTMELSISAPEALHGCISLPVGWQFADGDSQKILQSGKYTIYNRA